MSIRDRLDSNLAQARARILGARPSGAADVTLVAVTKSVEPDVALALAGLGVTDLGESRVQELERKQAAFAASGTEVLWHFLGHLQRNKARRVVQSADYLHSVDSLRLLETIGRLAAEEGRAPRSFLQVKLNDEPNKTGLTPAEVPGALERALALGLPVVGLMTMAPLVAAGDAVAAARETFERLVALGATLPPERFVDGAPRHSMGMSGDFEAAVAAGAAFVRIGSLLFEGLDADRAGAAGSAPR